MKPRVDSTTPEARVAIEAMLELVTANGADLHPGLVVKECRGHMSLHTDAADGELLIRLPEELLVPVDRTQWEANDDHLSIVSHDPESTSLHRDLLDVFARLYNATDKIRWARAHLPILALRSEPAALAAVRSLRPDFAQTELSIPQAFITTRVFQQGVRTQGEQRTKHVLMPVIDLLNHHALAGDYRVRGGAMSIVVHHSTDDTQCFVRYGPRRDPLDLALGHGHLDTRTSVAHSVRARIHVTRIGTVEIAGRRLPPSTALDPPQITMERGRLELSHTTFDADRPDRMLAILQLAVGAYIARYSEGKADATVTTQELLTRLAHTNLERLESAERQLTSISSDAAQLVVAAITAQRRIISLALAQISESPQGARSEADDHVDVEPAEQ